MMKHQQFFRGLACAHTLHWDIETRSPADLKVVGGHVYAANPATEIICLSFAVDDDPVKTWLPGEPVPEEFIEATANPSWTLCAHNSGFEAVILLHILHPRHGFPSIPPERQRCTQAMSLALGLPAKLSKLAIALEFDHRKDAAGERLMHMMSKPRKPRKYEDPNGIYWHDEPDKVQRLIVYNVTDVEVEREADHRLLPLSDAEQAIWLLSNKINSRGFCVDRKFALAARKIAGEVMPEINDELSALTDKVVTSINQVAKLKLWLQSQGCTTTSLDSDAIEKLLEGEELPTLARRALELRQAGAQAAARKLDALLASAGSDDRIRGSFKYHGASTGRWAGEGLQPQNLKKPETKDLDTAIAAVATGDYAHVKILYPKPLAIIGDCSRSMLIAAPGCRLIGADFSSIESRVLAWIAGEEWKLACYRRFDLTKDPHDEPYVLTAAKILRVAPDAITEDQRKVGKTCDLAFGYQGGLGAWRNFEPDQFTDAEVEIFKNEWRSSHPKIRQFWNEIDRAAVAAVRKRGEAIHCGMLVLKCVGMFLQIWLPSGRALSYPYPRIIKDSRGNSCVVFLDNGGGKFVDNNYGRGAYGGIWTENVVSAISRDLLVEAMLRVEAAGHPITLHVHDELCCEVPIGFGSEEELVELMTKKPDWVGELPIAAKAWSGPRYVK
jgi:DNA polymerase